VNISFLHLSVIIFQHYILHESLHHHAYAFNKLFVLQIAYHLFSCLLMHDPCVFLCKTKTKKRKHENLRCILSCIYLVPWANHVGIINLFHLKTKWLNMVPNARLTKKRCFFGHLNLIITFSMHSMSIPESFISMKCCRSIGDRNCHSLDYRVETSSCFYEKVHQVKLKYGSNHLAKNWGKRWIELHRCFIYCQTHLGLLMSLLLLVSP